MKSLSDVSTFLLSDSGRRWWVFGEEGTETDKLGQYRKKNIA
jgi:hypothetical protein